MALTALVIYSLAHSGPATAARSLLLPPAAVTNSGTADDQIYNLPSGDGDNQAILEDDGTPGNGMSQLRSGNGSFVTVVFANPSDTLTINAGNDGEKITVNKVDGGFNAKINLNGGTANDTFALGDGATLKGGAVDGKGGNNTLDYGAYTTPVSVNLGLGPGTPFIIANMDGLQATPPNASAATGSADLAYDHSGRKYDILLRVLGITPEQVTGVKIRRAPAGAAGPVVVDLGVGAVLPDGPNAFRLSASGIPVPPEQEAAFFGGLFYVADSRLPYLQFMRDTRQVGAGVVVGRAGYQGVLEVNKQAYLQQLVTSPAFLARFPITPAEEYVDALFASAGVTPIQTDRANALGAFGSGGTAGRAGALRAVADSASLRQAELLPSFVLAEYFGYLRRSPTDAPDFNNNGYVFWLVKLFQFNGDFQKAEMVKAFINSNEYRSRFGKP